MDNFDRQFKTMTGAIIGMWIVSALVSLAVVGFCIWGAVQLMQHFGVI